MTEKSILIIGAGVAGLCTGIYGQMNGYRTRIFEKHKIPGGLVTAFRRKGYLVDVCIHWLAGSGQLLMPLSGSSNVVNAALMLVFGLAACATLKDAWRVPAPETRQGIFILTNE